MFKQIQLAGQLFEEVQLKNIFPDSKTFVDATPKFAAELILKNYATQRLTAEFNLRQFILANFTLQANLAKEFQLDPKRSMLEHINYLWDILTRSADQHQAGSSLIPLPYPYTVPGGRFSEIYYWDSYFSGEGLAAAKRLPMVINMARNFAALILQHGSIPNGNRYYYLSRSQPPFFSSLVEIIFREQGINAILEYLPALDLEYKFWMEGPRAVNLNTDVKLNRYWDSNPAPREESYREDLQLACQLAPDQQATFFRNIRAACESGWDFSSRWFADNQNLSSIQTTDLLPVDLNSILYAMEKNMACWHQLNGNTHSAKNYAGQALKRQEIFNSYFWNDQQKYFFDYNYATKQQTKIWSLAAVYPLFFKLASLEQAAAVAEHIAAKFLKPGGVVTTLQTTGEQWDSPNGWAPLQWLTIMGLINYGYDELALEVATRFIRAVKTIFQQHGKIMEKYNVCDLSHTANGGEYPLQDGFGWTNGVVQAILKHFPQLI